MMRMSSTYHLYKIALLVKTDDAVKDSMILRAGEPSKALYFVVSGTVEVIQQKRKRVRSRASLNTGAGNAAGSNGNKIACNTVLAGGGGGSVGGAAGKSEKPHTHSPREGDGAAEFVYKTARRVLTVLESGEYFGESGVLTYFNGGSKSSAAVPPVTEQFCLVARTSVEMLVLRRKHFNIIEMPMLEIIKANHAARLQWRAQRKQDAHRGRAVLRAAKRALGQASARVGGEEDPIFQSCQKHLWNSQSRTAATGAAGNSSQGARLSAPADEGGDTSLLAQRQERGSVTKSHLSGRSTLPREEPSFAKRHHHPPGDLGANDLAGTVVSTTWGAGRNPMGGDEEQQDGGGDDKSLAGLSVASGDSMQYSVDSGWLPTVAGVGNNSPVGGDRASTHAESQGLDDDRDAQQPQQGDRPQGHRPYGLNSGVENPKPSGALAGSVSLPNLGLPAGLGDESAAGRGPPFLGIGVKGAGGTRRGKPARYTGHKQLGLHGSKSFGAFLGAIEQRQGDGSSSNHSGYPPRPPLRNRKRLKNGAETSDSKRRFHAARTPETHSRGDATRKA
ncbi:unnamed protein product, partial [Ectocarpus sp. 12 AP-2014]